MPTHPDSSLNHPRTVQDLYFLKLGGSLITDKFQPHTARLEIIQRIAQEIAFACRKMSGLKLVLGHGSGSFGHVPAKRYQIRQGVNTLDRWQGFVKVWREAYALNSIVMEQLLKAGLPAVAFPPVSSVITRDRKVVSWDLEPIQNALASGLVPVVYGDVVYDLKIGGTILSTEDIFSYMLTTLKPTSILLAGREPGVWADFPACTRLLSHITPQKYHEIRTSVIGSQATDVTGGMATKLALSLTWTNILPDLEVVIFSGEAPGSIFRALSGESLGTRITA